MKRKFEDLKVGDRLIYSFDGYISEWVIKEKANNRMFYLIDTMSYTERSMYQDDYNKYFVVKEDMFKTE